MNSRIHVGRKLLCMLAASLCGLPAWATLGQMLPPGTVPISTTSTSTNGTSTTSTSPATSPTSSPTTGVSTPGTTLRSALESTTGNTPGYTSQNTTLPGGTTVTEYATPAGMVFAVAWEGPVLPALDALLGTYFTTFKSQADATRAQRGPGTPLTLQSSGLVILSRGRMGRFSGHAYDPRLVPSGLDISHVLP